MGEQTVNRRVLEVLPDDPVITAVRGVITMLFCYLIHVITGDGKCHIAAIQGCKSGLRYWLGIHRSFAGGSVLMSVCLWLIFYCGTD